MCYLMTASERYRLAIACIVAAFMIGWLPFLFHNRVVTFVAAALGVIGGIPFLLINGVHGDMEGARGVVGGILFVVVNAAVYYAIIGFAIRLIRRRRHQRTSIEP